MVDLIITISKVHKSRSTLYTVEPRYYATRYYANSTTTPTFRKRGFFPSLSLLKKTCYYANFVLREFTTKPVFADHQLVFSS